MFHVHFSHSKETMEELLADFQEETGMGLTSYVKERENGGSSYEVSIGDLYETWPKEELEKLFTQLNEKMKTTR
jgi:hypothetical protein